MLKRRSLWRRYNAWLPSGLITFIVLCALAGVASRLMGS